jgi:hypothetical protein
MRLARDSRSRSTAAGSPTPRPLAIDPGAEHERDRLGLWLSAANHPTHFDLSFRAGLQELDREFDVVIDVAGDRTPASVDKVHSPRS